MATQTSALTGVEPRLVLGALRGDHEDRAPVTSRGTDDRVRARLGRRARLRVAAGCGSQPASSAFLPAKVENRRPWSCSRGTWTWSASGSPTARTIRPRDGSSSIRDGDWLTADGTTLGADDGVAIAAMMALVEDESLPHGPLELLMTVAEEVGLEGANELDGSLLSGAILHEPRQRGGRHAHRRVRGQHRHVDPDRRATCSLRRRLDDLLPRSSGGLGGHSGVQIALGRANAIKVLGRVLRAAHAMCRSGSSRSTAARAGTRSRATPSRSARFRATKRMRSGPR